MTGCQLRAATSHGPDRAEFWKAIADTARETEIWLIVHQAAAQLPIQHGLIRLFRLLRFFRLGVS